MGAYLWDADLEGANVKNTILEKKEVVDDKDKKIQELEEKLAKIKSLLDT